MTMKRVQQSPSASSNPLSPATECDRRNAEFEAASNRVGRLEVGPMIEPNTFPRIQE